MCAELLEALTESYKKCLKGIRVDNQGCITGRERAAPSLLSGSAHRHPAALHVGIRLQRRIRPKLAPSNYPNVFTCVKLSCSPCNDKCIIMRRQIPTVNTNILVGDCLSGESSAICQGCAELPSCAERGGLVVPEEGSPRGFALRNVHLGQNKGFWKFVPISQKYCGFPQV